MKSKISSLATITAVAVLALLGVGVLSAVLAPGNDVASPAYAATAVPTATPIPPIVPFKSSASDTVDSTKLGDANASFKVVTNNPVGTRPSLPWIFSGPGFWVSKYQGTEGRDVGTVYSDIDVQCDGQIDNLYAPSDGNPAPDNAGCTDPDLYHWYERAIDPGLPASETYLLNIMPPYPWIFRQRADISQVCLASGIAVVSPSVLNTVIETLPISPVGPKPAPIGTPMADGTPYPNGHTQIETTILGGSSISPPSAVCLDSSQNSVSNNAVPTGVPIRHNPPLATTTPNPVGPKGAGGRALDDNSGLYVKWTIFGSFGSSSLSPRYGDLTAAYQSPPSIASDQEYIERIIQTDCWWLDDNGCSLADCDGSNIAQWGGPASNPADGQISAMESWNDPDLKAITNADGTGINAVDKDRDCLMTDTTQQPNWFAPIDDIPEPIPGTGSDAVCPTLQYSVAPSTTATYNKAADADCDGLLNSVEWAYGSDPTVADTDGDGASDFVEMFQFTNPLVKDTDGDGFQDKPSSVYADNTDTSVDNCPSVSNPSQLNSDGHFREVGIHDYGTGGAITTSANPASLLTDTGTAAKLWTHDQWKDQWVLCLNAGTNASSNIKAKFQVTAQPACTAPNCNVLPGVDGWVSSDPVTCPGGISLTTISSGKAANPNQDKLGDACDPDDDNDQAVDTYETAKGSSTTNMDTDGDTVNDGAELQRAAAGDTLGLPLDPTKKPTWIADGTSQVYYRGCHVNLEGGGTNWDEDGDGFTCIKATVGSADDVDSDDGHPGALPEVNDKVEAFGFGLAISNADTDGDGCADWVEIHDLDGNRKVDSGDTGQLSKRVAGLVPANAVSDLIYNVDKNVVGATATQKLDSGDTGQINKNTCQVKHWGGCDLCPLKP